MKNSTSPSVPDTVVKPVVVPQPPLFTSFLKNINFPGSKCLVVGIMLQMMFSHNVLAQQPCNTEAAFTAQINNVPFQFRPDWPFSGKLLTEQGAMNGSRPTRNVVNLTLYGANYTTPAGDWFSEQIEFQIQFSSNPFDSIPLCSVELHYNGGVYSFMQGQGQLKITDFTWSADHRSFTFSGNYGFTMRSWAYASTGSPDVELTGKLTDVHVTVPGWLLAKN